MTTAVDRQQFVMGRVVAAGYPAIVGAVFVGNGCGESGQDLDSTFERVHADHGSGGFLEWRDSPGAPRKTRLAQFAALHGANTSDLGMQVDYAIWELGKYFPDLDAQLRNPGTRSIENLTANFCNIFENPASATAGVTNRIAHAKSALADWENAQRAPPTPLPQVPAPQIPAHIPGLPAPPAAPPIPASWAARLAIELDQLMSLQRAYRAEFPTPFDEAIAALQKLGTGPISGSSGGQQPKIPAANPAALAPRRTSVMDSISPQVSALIRNVLIFGGGIVVSKGWLDNTTMVAIVGGVMSLGGAAWSAWGHSKTSIIAAAASLPEVQKVVTTSAIADSPKFAANNRVVAH